MTAAHEVKRHAISGEGNNILVARLIYLIFAVIVTFTLIRMILLSIGAALDDNIFVNFIYAVSEVLVAPFFFIFGIPPTYGAPVFEISSLVALLVYILMGWGLAFLVTYGSWHSDEV